MERLEEQPNQRTALRAAFPATLPVLTGYACLGLAYGLLMAANGYGPLWSALMSAIGFGGSMQYVAITLLVTAFDPLQAFLLAVTSFTASACWTSTRAWARSDLF